MCLETIKRGEIYLVDLPKIEGSIQFGKRPCILLSNQKALDCSPIINVIPLTSKLKKVYPMHVLIGTNCGLNIPSYALPEQSMPIMKERLIHKIGECDEYTLRRVEEGTKIQQGIKENNNKKLNFDIKHVENSVQSIKEWEHYVIKNNISSDDFIFKNIKLQIDVLYQYCLNCGEDINKYYKPMINFYNSGGVKKYA